MWDLKLANEGLKVYLKKAATSSELPYIRMELSFNKALRVNQIVKAFYLPEHRRLWDKNSIETLEVRPLDHPNATLMYTLNKSKFSFKPKEFVEKRFLVAERGVSYCYFTSSQLHESDQPVT